MRVSTKTVSGFGILLGLACIGLAYQVSVIHQMQSINRDLSAINFRASSIALRTIDLGDTIEEFTRKYFVAGDPIYERQLEGVRQEFLANLMDLRSTVRSDRERSAVDRLFLTFDEYSNGFKHHKSQNERADLLPNDVASSLDRLKAQTRTTYATL